MNKKLMAAALAGAFAFPVVAHEFPPAPTLGELGHKRSPNDFRRGKWLRDARKAKRRQVRLSRRINRA